MKKFVIVLVVLLILLGVLAVSASIHAEFDEEEVENYDDQNEDELVSTLATGIVKCVNSVEGVNVRDAAGYVKRHLNNADRVTTYESLFMRGENFVRIGSNEYVAVRYLTTACAAPAPTPVTPTAPSTPAATAAPAKPAPATAAPVASSASQKIAITLKQIFQNEGSCQNSASDSGNTFQGKVGYTCVGVTPSLGYNNRNGEFSYALPTFKGHPSAFVKYAYDLSAAKFTVGAGNIYAAQYFTPGACSNLPQPAHYVCSDIAVNSGPGKSSQYVKELGKIGADVKAYARALNEKHRQFYKKIGVGANAKFLAGWLARANARDAFINKY